MADSRTRITYTSQNVNSKLLYEYMIQNLYECASLMRVRNTHEGVQYEHTDTEYAVVDFMEDCIESNRITHYDHEIQLHTSPSGRTGGIDVTIKFRQANCYNVTTITAQLRPAT